MKTITTAAQYRATATEKQVQQAIVQTLRLAGFVVEEIGQHRADLSGQSAGVQDLQVQVDGCPLALTIEVKVPGKERKFSNEAQKRAVESGRRVLVTDQEQALVAARDWLYWAKKAGEHVR